MATHYPFDPARSRFTVQAFAAGLLSSLGHSPTFAVSRYSGDIQFGGGEIKNLGLVLDVHADSLSLLDHVSAHDRSEIESRMRHDVLETTTYSVITYRASAVSENRLGPGHFQVRVAGPLTLHGQSHEHSIDADLTVFPDGLLFKGESHLHLSDYHIKPVAALGGTIRLKDDLRIFFDIGAPLEES
jgi:polyisoprenoid-binding protein YceI